MVRPPFLTIRCRCIPRRITIASVSPIRSSIVIAWNGEGLEDRALCPLLFHFPLQCIEVLPELIDLSLLLLKGLLQKHIALHERVILYHEILHPAAPAGIFIPFATIHVMAHHLATIRVLLSMFHSHHAHAALHSRAFPDTLAGIALICGALARRALIRCQLLLFACFLSCLRRCYARAGNEKHYQGKYHCCS